MKDVLQYLDIRQKCKEVRDEDQQEIAAEMGSGLKNACMWMKEGGMGVDESKSNRIVRRWIICEMALDIFVYYVSIGFLYIYIQRKFPSHLH